MANTIRIKRRLTGNAVAPTSLKNAELAFNEVNTTLYYGKGDANDGTNNATSVIPIAGDGVVWTGTQTFGTVTAGGGVYAYKDTYPVDPKLLATIDYVDDAISRGSGATLYPHAANADCATTSPLLTAAPYDKLQSFADVRVAWTPTTLSSYQETYPLSGLKQLQGVTLAAGDRVLLLNHLQPGFKGIWVVSTGQWTRASGAEYAAFYPTGKRVKVVEGLNANKIYEVAAPGDRPTNDNRHTPTQLAWNVTTAQPITAAAALYQRVVRAASSVFTIENNKIKVDGVVLNEGDRFLWMPEYTGSGGAAISGIFFDTPEPQPTGGIYRVDYSNVTTTGTPYAAAVRDRDLLLATHFQDANGTKVLVREGTTNKQKIYTINAATPFTVGTTVPTFTHSSTYSDSAPGFRGQPVIDGYQTQVENLSSNPPQIGSTILVKDEVDETYNGLYYIPALSGAYTVNDVPWIRHPTADAAGELVYGSYIRVFNGSVNKNLAFVQIGEGGEDKIITPSNEIPAGSGTTSAADNNPDRIVFQPATATSDITAGIGLAKANRTLYVKTASTARITVSEAGVDLATVPGAGTDGLTASTAYILTHVDSYGRVTENSSTTITATDFRNKLFSVSADDTSTGTGNVVFSDSPVFTGTPTINTAIDANDDSTKIATTAWVTDALATGGGAQLLTADNTWTGANIFRKTSGTRFEQADGQAAVIVAGGAASSGNFTTTISPTNASPATGSGAVATLTANRTITLPDASTTLVGFDTTQTLSNKTLSAPKMTGTHIADTNGAELIVFPAVVTGAVNEITVTNAISGARPTISASGNDPNIDLALSGKGTGAVFVNGSIKLATANATSIADVNGNEIIKFPTTVGSATNEITVTNAVNGSSPEISATGSSDSNIDLKLTAKGTGAVTSTSNFTVSSGKALNLSTAATVTAAGNAQANAFALTNDINVVSTAPASTGVALPTGTAGRRVVVINRGANAITVYPASGGTIDALAANAGIALPINAQLQFYAATPTQWYSETVRAESVTGTLAVGSGGTGATSFTNGALLKGAGTNAITTATSGTDYAPATPGGTAILKANNAGGFSSATAGSDYAPATPAGTAILKANNAGGFSSATAGNDYVVGGTTTVGKIVTQASVTTGAALLISSGVAPTTGLVAGDFWNENGVLKFQPTGTTSSTTKTIAYTDSTITGNAGGLTNTLVATSGGTGQSSYSTGDFLYAGGTNPSSLTKLTKASSGTVGALIQDGTTGVPSWQTVTGTGNVVRATSPAFTTDVTCTNTDVFSVFNTNALQINAFGAANLLNIGVNTLAGQITNIATGAITSGTRAINIGTNGGAGSVTNVTLGSPGGGTVTVSKDLTVAGNLTVNGTTITLNTATLSVDDKNIELGSVTVQTGISGTVSNAASGSATITVSSTSNIAVGQTLTRLSGASLGTNPVVATVVDGTTLTITCTGTPGSGAVVFNVSGANEDTADGGGITIKGTSDKTFNWVKNTSAWTSSEHIALAAGKTVILNGSTSGSVTLSVPPAAGTTTISFPATNGTVITTGDTGTVSATMLASNAVTTAKIADNAVTFAKLPNSAAAGLSVIGQSAASAANFAEINAGTDGHVLRRSGSTLGFGTIATAGIADNAVTFAKLPNSAADGLSVVGRSANSAGNFAEINAATDGYVLRRSGTALGFGTIATAGIADNAVTFAKLPNSAAAGLSVVGRSANSAGNFAEINAATDGQVLRRSGSGLGFGAIDVSSSAAVSGTLAVGNGGTGVTTLTGLVKGNGTSNFSAAAAGTDYVVAGTPTVGGLLLSTTDGITAAGTTQANATALTNDINVVTTTPTATGVRLPAPAAGRVIAVVNRGANALKVYPATSTAINTLGNNAAFSVAANATLTLRGSSTTQWYAELTSESPCSLVADCTLDGGSF